MVKEFVVMAEKAVGEGDKIQNGYAAKHDGQGGWLFLSGKKLVFIEEKGGFLSKKYNLILDMPYEKIAGTSVENLEKLVVSEAGGGQHTFTSDASTSVVEIEKKLKQLKSPKK